MLKVRNYFEILNEIVNKACEWQKAYDAEPEEHPDGAEFAKYLENLYNELRIGRISVIAKEDRGAANGEEA